MRWQPLIMLGTGYCLDTSPGRLMYFYYNPEQYFKYIRPVKGCDQVSGINLAGRGMKNRLQSAGRVEIIPGGRHGRYSLSGRGGCTASYAVRKC